MFVGIGKARACQSSGTTQPTSNYNSGCVDPARQHSCWAQCLRALLVRQLFALLHFLRSCALWPSSPDVVRASGLSGLFGVWLALPECDVVSLAGRVSLPFGFAAVLPPATFTCVYCRAYSFSLLRSFRLSCRSPHPVVLPPSLLCGLGRFGCCLQPPLPCLPCSHLFFAVIAPWLH